MIWGRAAPVPFNMWHPVVICGACGHRHVCARSVDEPCCFNFVCHRCEVVLEVRLTNADLEDQRDWEMLDTHHAFQVRGLALSHPAK